MRKRILCPFRIGIVLFVLSISFSRSWAQDIPVTDTISVPVTDTIIDSIPVVTDTVLRIKNLNPYFTLHVDSTLNYKLEINKPSSGYYWFLRN